MSALDWALIGVAAVLVALALVLALSRLPDHPDVNEHPAHRRPGADKQFDDWPPVRLPTTSTPPKEPT